MRIAELMLQTTDIEFLMTRRMLQAVPEGRADFAPHPKSMPLGRLAMHVATLPALGIVCLTTDDFDALQGTPRDLTWRSGEHLLQTFDQTSSRFRELLASATEEDLATPWRFGAGGRVFSNNPRATSLNHMLFGHLSHHRAQLGTYLRALDLPVPGVYGPSADDRLR